MNIALLVFLMVLEKLESASIPYMVVGSIASMVYGEPRLTHDMNLVVDVLPGDALKFASLFDNEDFYCPPLEVEHAKSSRGARASHSRVKEMSSWLLLKM